MFRQSFHVFMLILAGSILITRGALPTQANGPQPAPEPLAALTLEQDRPLSSAVDVLIEQPPAPQDNSEPGAAETLLAREVFRNPVVPGATISGYFDHNEGNDYVTFYDGRRNVSPAYGFYFQCSTPYMYDFVGCADNVIGEGSCANNRELWYDGHHGIDYEFSADWHTGAFCNPGKFGNLTKPIYAPARGLVQYVGYNHQFNGNHMFILHDANGNGNFYDDGLRAAYLHFATLAVQTGQIVEEGQFLGNGGSTGYSSSPHLHFEVQRSDDGFASRRWPVDPYGWQGTGADPYPYFNEVLWKQPAPPPPPPPPPMNDRIYMPGLFHQTTSLIRNPGFESGSVEWQMVGVDIITNTSHPNLRVAPFQGSWLAWLGGRPNAVEALYQTFKVPQGIQSATFEYFVHVAPYQGNVDDQDRMYVRLRGPDGVSVVRHLDTITGSFDPDDQWVRRAFTLNEISAYQGQTLRITFNATTDADSETRTSFYVDNVTITASTVPGFTR